MERGRSLMKSDVLSCVRRERGCGGAGVRGWGSSGLVAPYLNAAQEKIEKLEVNSLSKSVQCPYTRICLLDRAGF